MVFIKHNSLKSDIFFNPIFIPGCSWSGSRVQVPGPGSRIQGPGPGSGSRFQKKPNISTVQFSLRGLIKNFLVGYLDAQMSIILSQKRVYFDRCIQVTKHQLFHEEGPCRKENSSLFALQDNLHSSYSRCMFLQVVKQNTF